MYLRVMISMKFSGQKLPSFTRYPNSNLRYAWRASRTTAFSIHGICNPITRDTLIETSHSINTISNLETEVP